MNKIKPLDQKRLIGEKAANPCPKLQNKSESGDSILSRLIEFASSVSDFRRTGKGNIRHKLTDIIILMVFARLSKCIGRAEIIEFADTISGNLRRWDC